MRVDDVDADAVQVQMTDDAVIVDFGDKAIIVPKTEGEPTTIELHGESPLGAFVQTFEVAEVAPPRPPKRPRAPAKLKQPTPPAAPAPLTPPATAVPEAEVHRETLSFPGGIVTFELHMGPDAGLQAMPEIPPMPQLQFDTWVDPWPRPDTDWQQDPSWRQFELEVQQMQRQMQQQMRGFQLQPMQLQAVPTWKHHARNR